MPHINRIRVNNVKYNFGTQFYDDFLMRFSGKNTIYDLANGGGKSVLMLLLLQNLIPNCTLDDKQPIEKLFRTNEGSTTIHSMIEWTLSDAHIKDNFKYMLTGFCARKAKESGNALEAASNDSVGNTKNSSQIEYFNYVIFYRKFNDNDIKNLPLCKNGERITYTGLKNYLRELEKKDLSLQVKIFETKGDYQRFIAMYGLYESEWEIIRGINKTEGHVRTYFETKYKTTRKVVEDLLIEGIIEKSFKNTYINEGNEDMLAQTLLDIKDKLIELSKKKDEINNFDRQTQIITDFMERITSVKQMYLEMDEAFLKIKRIYNSVLELSGRDEGVKGNLEEQLSFGLDEKKNLAKKVETAKVILEKDKLSKIELEVQKLENEYEELNNEIEAFQESLSIREGGNYYIEYLEAKKEYDKLMIVMDNILKDNSEILDSIKESIAFKKISDDRRKRELLESIASEEVCRAGERDKIEEKEIAFKALTEDIAVTEYEISAGEKKMTEIDAKVSMLKNETSLLLPSEAKNSRINKENENEKISENLVELKNKLKDTMENELELKLEYQKYDNELRRCMDSREELENRAKKILNSEEKLDKLKEVYQESNIDRLGEIIEKSYRTMITSLEKDKRELKKLNDKIESLKEGNPVGESIAIKNVIEYINRYHTKNAFTGAEIIKGLTENERVSAVRNNPILPYSIVIFEKADQITNDWEIANLSENGELVPILVSESREEFVDAIKNDELIKNENLVCILGDPEKYKEEKIQKQLTKYENILEEKQRSYDRKTENEDVIKEDYLFVKLISGGLVDESQINPKKTMDKLNENIKNYSVKMENVQKRIYDCGYDMEAIRNEIEEKEKILVEITGEINILIQIEKSLEEYKIAETKVFELKAKLENDKKTYLESEKHLEALLNMNQNRVKRINALKLEVEEINRLWEEKYSAYFDEKIYREIVSKDNIKEVQDVEIEALLDGLKNDNSSIDDKEKLLNNYQISMQRSLQRIDYLGLSTEMFENMLKNKDLTKTTNDELQQIRLKEDNTKKKRKEFRKIVDGKRSERDQLSGGISHRISVIEREYGSYDEGAIKREEINTFINENGKILEMLNKRIGELNNQIKAVEEREMLLSVLKKDCEGLMERALIKPDMSAGSLANMTAKKALEEYHEAAKGLDVFINNKFKKSEQFKKDLDMLIDTLKMLGATELASEIRMNINMPNSAKEADELTEAFIETNSFILLERERVVKGLQDIQIIKDNFEKQCIQSCINIKTELERLSRLSRITIDDENISMINLKIPFVNEELYQDRMSDYIDRIAKGADGFEKTEDKLKFIRNNLCWKKMFSVIVTDMNGIKLNLYKRERIAKQSRYLPYEEAVGSTGQSQGIYIQFLVSIINYISSINSKNSDATSLKKVIFIDNPFGAAKDIYIWEPIFKLLKTNNVQLIVPARGATPAITGRFDVNYILGQKLKDGKQQTVVVDYYSNVQGEELDYTTLTFEQAELF